MTGVGASAGHVAERPRNSPRLYAVALNCGDARPMLSGSPWRASAVDVRSAADASSLGRRGPSCRNQDSTGRAYLWPGLPQVWLRGSWVGLTLAVGFTALANVLLAATLVWDEWLPARARWDRRWRRWR